MAVAIADALVMNKALIGRNAVNLLRLTPGALAISAAGAALQSILTEAAIQMNGDGTAERLETVFAAHTWTVAGGATNISTGCINGFRTGSVYTSVRTYQAAFGEARAALGACPVASRTYSFPHPIVYTGLNGGAPRWTQQYEIRNSAGTVIESPTITVQSPSGRTSQSPGVATDADLLAAINREPDSSPRLSQTMQWLKDANHPLTFDGTEQASLTGAAAESAPYDIRTVTRPDGSVESSQTVDRVTPTPNGNAGPVTNNNITFNQTSITTIINPEGTTEIEEQLDPIPGNSPTEEEAEEPEERTGNVTGTRLGEVPTFAASTTGGMERIKNAPLVAAFAEIADSIPDGGSCQFPTFTLLGQQFSHQVFCDVLTMYEDTFRKFALFVWTISACFIFFRRT